MVLDRDTFRKQVFVRDGNKCVLCGRGAPLDAHHIMERRLFADGGYYLDNGATLCDGRDEVGGFYPGCHLKAEQTVIPPDVIRNAAGIRTVILPEHLYEDLTYDKWGNPIFTDGTRAKGELFADSSIQKVLASAGMLSQFRNRMKYPRTFHLPWSGGRTDDDRVLSDTRMFEGRRVIITEKMDGENTSMYSDYIHARSLDGESDSTQSWVRNLHSQIQGNIPNGFRVCGENLFAKHTLHYKDLAAYFLVFSIWDQNNVCLSWDETLDYAALLDLQTVPVLYDGMWDETMARRFAEEMDLTAQEGYVVRLAEAFAYGSFSKCVAKFVRAQHVGASHNWKRQVKLRNLLRR